MGDRRDHVVGRRVAAIEIVQISDELRPSVGLRAHGIGDPRADRRRPPHVHFRPRDLEKGFVHRDSESAHTFSIPQYA